MTGPVKVNHLEDWFIDLLKEIEQAAENNEEYNLHLDKKAVQDLAFESRSLEWIEIY